MNRPEIIVPDVPFLYGGDLETLCRECQLPCKLDTTSIDCMRRFFLQSYLQCTYCIYGYCFLIDTPGCVFDNGGVHETYWLNLLNEYFHAVGENGVPDGDFARRSEELKQLVFEQIQSRQISLCRYVEEMYNRVMETGGGLGEEMMERLDEAYLALLCGTSRKR